MKTQGKVIGGRIGALPPVPKQEPKPKVVKPAPKKQTKPGKGAKK